MNFSIDLLADRYYADAFGNRAHKGILLFFRLLIIRCFFLTTLLTIVLSYLFKEIGVGKEISVHILVLVAALIEEQARWLFTRYSRSTPWSVVQFSLMAITVESIGYYSGGATLYTYGIFRLSSILVHAVNAGICFISFRLSQSKRLALFFLAVAFHVYMNTIGWKAIVDYLLPNMGP